MSLHRHAIHRREEARYPPRPLAPPGNPPHSFQQGVHERCLRLRVALDERRVGEHQRHGQRLPRLEAALLVE